MEKGFYAEKLAMITILTILTGVICLAATGCGEEMARIEQKQPGLQKFMHINTQQMTDNMSCIKDNQSKLHVAMEDVQDDTTKQTIDIITAIQQEHAALQNILQILSQQLTNSIIGIEQDP